MLAKAERTSARDRPTRSQIICAILTCLAAGGLMLPAAAQQEGTRKEKPWQPVTISAEALKFGAALEEQALPGLKDWAHSQVTKKMHESVVDPKATMAVVDARFPQASDEARDAGIFLVFFTAYKDEDENQRMLALRIRDIDRETTEITRQLQLMWKNEQTRSASPLQAISAQERVRLEEQEQRMTAQLREYADERQLKSNQLAASRKKVNAYLKLLGAAFERMKDTDAAIVRTLKESPSN